MSKFYRKFDSMTWPVPGEDMAEAAWRCVHGSPSKSDLLLMVSVFNAYQELIKLPINKRNAIITELRKGANV